MKIGISDRRRGLRDIKVKFDAESCRAAVREKLQRRIPRDLPPQLRMHLKDVLGLEPRAPLSNYGSNLATISALSRAIGEIWTSEWHLHDERQLEFLTITPPGWWVSEFSPVLDLSTWRSDVSRWLRNLGFTGMGIIEPAPFQRIKHERGGRAISFHFHAVGYTDNPCTYQSAIRELKEVLGPNRTSLPTVVSKPIEGTAADVRYVGEYIAKPVDKAKNSVMRRDGKGEALRNVELPGQLAIRVQEMMSYFTLSDMIVTRGKVGLHCKREVLHAVGKEAVTRFPSRMSDGALRRYWTGLWTYFARQTGSEKKRRRCREYAAVTALRRRRELRHLNSHR